ncbi:molecular chaperone [Candidatus Methylomirabilis limnetica]|jgi:HSP20 family protein|uniref:Molecular chaperone n=1 Tax=Candidatus Methylomirabilis limnetica TaxID=2033718 RepID=A0A2T4TVX1_9BACT|nr:Hsp20/alpha crystallin family protein [Candidatus Methylomirabilis limnetica]PTL35259.1 molecular chaperone [Candidatus Methylomirabilis limnetica]
MAIIRWDPFRDVMTLQERMNHLFDHALSRTRGDDKEGLTASMWSPSVDIFETPDSIVMKAELPGVSRDNIDIQVQDNTLTLKGERKSEHEVKEENYLRVERSYGAFQRTFNLPTGVQQGKIRAVFKDGVLEVTMPKAEEAKPTQVKIDVT